MTSRPEPSRENLRWHDECGGVRPKIREEEGQRVQQHEPNSVVLVSPVVVRNCQSKHEHCHEEETHQLNSKSSHLVNESHCKPVARHSTAESNKSLSSGNLVNFLKGIHGLCRRDPSNGTEDVLLEQILTVESDVKQEPSTSGSKQVKAMSMQKLL
ncbi:hypothetical protein PanWU01x14_137350 [Parasponia andersonii]|uniref:Uncharacterized protein n=1 Tax=Parasponia andersonii TaxID=3476 RepID=A0A2P5CNI7_PARAD|nr:hypothetical protein PanWU01x14_137350 [Parasponia andersonii]